MTTWVTVGASNPVVRRERAHAKGQAPTGGGECKDADWKGFNRHFRTHRAVAQCRRAAKQNANRFEVGRWGLQGMDHFQNRLTPVNYSLWEFRTPHGETRQVREEHTDDPVL